jgi:hypothetical protein
MSLIENFIANKIYSALYLDFLLKFIWERIVELWHIGGSAIPGAIVLLLLMLVIVLIPLIPVIALGYGIYKLLKYYEVI